MLFVYSLNMRTTAFAVVLSVFFAFLPPASDAAGVPVKDFAFKDPIDAVSVELPTASARGTLQAYANGKWTDTEVIEPDNEQDPRLRESNLVIFPTGVTAVRISGIEGSVTLHPIRVPRVPVQYDVAARGRVEAPFILSRGEWGADESLRVRRTTSSSSSTSSSRSSASSSVPPPTTDNGNDAANDREQTCLDAQRNFPGDFRTSGRKVMANDNGEPLLWPQEYSPSIKLIAVHHTAGKVSGDTRSGAERMRAIYQYHAVSRGWGDIGYHYVIDEGGQVYEGRAGGDYVIAGHAYCNNTGTIGVALMGNFEVEEPTQAQMKSLQKLIAYLGDKYHIDPNGTTVYHGKTLPTVVGHRDLLSTTCPGYYAYAVLDQVRRNAASGNVDASIRFPAPPRRASSSSVRPRTGPTPPRSSEFLTPLGSTELSGRPGGELTFTVRMQAGNKPLAQRASIGALVKSDPSMAVWEEGDAHLRLRDKVLVPSFIRAGEFKTVRFRVKLPAKEGTYSLTLAGMTYRLTAGGRRTREPATINTNRRISRATPVIMTDTSDGITKRTSSSAGSSRSSHPANTAARTPASNPTIRIRLGYQADTQNASIAVPDGSVANGAAAGSEVFVRANGDACEAWMGGALRASGVIRIDPGAGISTIASWNRPMNKFRGVLECRILDKQLVLINELPLEDYMAGLGEEPDTEPYEKQRAFAAAARTYAAWYLSADNRKFPGMPYDGSDAPSQFQKYSGYAFETANPNWVKAVKNTAGLVLKYNGSLIKPPYFSSDDGRTRSPAEAGLGANFPFASVFQSKPDPWCNGMKLAGHGVGMSGCGAEGQANEGKTAEEILQYYYPGTVLKDY